MPAIEVVRTQRGTFIAKDVSLSSFFRDRASWGKPIKLLYSFNGKDFYSMEQVVTVVPDLHIVHISLRNQQLEVEVNNAHT